MLPAPTPAAKEAARLVGRIGDIARGVGRLLHAEKNEQENSEDRPQNGKDMHGSLSLASMHLRRAHTCKRTVGRGDSCPSRGCQPTTSSGRKFSAISVAAFSTLSEPCTELRSMLSAYSLRMVPAAALVGSVAPITSR